MRLGPVLDLRNFREYTERFERCVGGPLACAEVHLVQGDVEGEGAFLRAMEASASFFRGRGVDRIAYHLLDDVVNDLLLHDLLAGRPEFASLLPGTDPSRLRGRLAALLQGTAAATAKFGAEVVAVVHEGVYFRADALRSLGRPLLKALRTLFLSRIQELHAAYFAAHAGQTAVYLENSPPFRGSSPTVQHFVDQLIGDIAARLTLPHKMVFDVSHSFLCRHYALRQEGEHPGLDLAVSAEGRGVPANDYRDIEAAAASIGWIHLNDCTAVHGHREGLALFQEDSLVDWGRLTSFLKDMDVPMVLEIASAEKDFSLLERSFRNLQDVWGSPDPS